MSNPWDPPPAAKRGNKDRRTLLEAVGRALTTWEELEAALASLYASLSGADRYDRKAFHLYGEEPNFNGRLHKLERIGQIYFVEQPHQQREGELLSIIKQAEGWARRRNDIAHGLVRAIQLVADESATILAIAGDEQWCLVPPEFKEAKYVSRYQPKYILSSRQINAFARSLWPIIHRTYAFVNVVEHPQHALRRQRIVPPPPTLRSKPSSQRV